MVQLTFGNNRQLSFQTEEQFYEALGCFSNREAFLITFEANSQTFSYADAYRIKKKTNRKLMDPIEKALRNAGRINCNEYVLYIMKHHGFYQDNEKHILCDPQKVLETVPFKFQKNFIYGYNNCSSLKDPSLVPRDYTRKTIKQSYTRQNTNSSFTRKKTDYIEKQKSNSEIGYKGEQLVYNREYDKLKKAAEDGIIGSVDEYLKWVSLEDDSKGYDIQSYSIEQKKTLYIEVKTTTGSQHTSFYISQKEVEFSKNHENNYVLMRLYNYKDNQEVPFFTIEGDITKTDLLDLKEDTFKAVMK